jgi:hypothetical protein
MDQFKEYVKLAIKYRFWIIVGVSALLPLIGYFAVAGGIDAQTTKLTGEIKQADDGVKPFQSGVPAVPRWTELTKNKTELVTTDVNKSWRTLYARQAPLLDWPPEVEKDFKAWGEGWPKDVDANKVQVVIDTYVQVYPRYVEKVYQSFHPWNPEDGSGIVFAPPKQELLRPAVYTLNNPPTLGKVHIAQKRLWIQRTLLDIVRNVNELAKAKDWDTAWLKQITGMEVASAFAQDQKSAAQGQALVIPEEPKNPNAPAAPPASTSLDQSGRMGNPGMTGPPGSQQDVDVNQFIDAGAAKDKFDIVPVAIEVLIDQDHIPDLLIAFENSPMAIQVVDVDWQRSLTRVTKPVMGETTGFDTGSFGMSSLGRRNPFAGMQSMYGAMGGAGNSAQDRMRQEMGKRGGGSFASGYTGEVSPGMGGGMRAGSEDAKVKHGKSRKDEALKAERERRAELKKDKEKDKDKDKEPEKKAPARTNTIHDPYYNIVQVHIYGQARFYKRPPEETAPAPSAGDAAADAAKQAGAAPDAKKEETKGESTKEAGKDAPAKEEPTKDQAKGDDAKAKSEAPKTEAATDAPKAEGKAEEKKDGTAKEEPKAADAPKADAPKGDTAKDQPKSKDDAGKDQPKAKDDSPPKR